MPVNDFLTFGLDPVANVINQATYAALSARNTGFVAGLADASQANKVWRQSSFMSAVIAKFISDTLGVDVLDDTDLAGKTLLFEKAIIADIIYPIPALEYPTISTTLNTIGAAGNIVVGAGGSVTIPAGINLTLGQEVIAASTGRLLNFQTVTWTSANLLANSTYYLRAQVDGAGALLNYVQRGTDTDAIPAGLKGTPNAATGGGFDSTQIDILFAKVVTGANGTMPTVTNLANARFMAAHFGGSVVQGGAGWSGPDAGGGVSSLVTFTYNWGRTPKIFVPWGSISFASVAGGGFLEGMGYAADFNGVAPNRYSRPVRIAADYNSAAILSTGGSSNQLEIAA